MGADKGSQLSWKALPRLPIKTHPALVGLYPPLDEHSQEALAAARQGVGKKAMEIFDVACSLRNFSPSDFESFGYASLQALRPQIKGLEDVGLLVSTQDENDKRRKTIQVTAKGWLVRHALDVGKSSAAN